MGLGLVRLCRKLGGGGDCGWQCQGLERLKRWRKHWWPRTGKDRGSHRPCPPPGPSPLVNSDFKSTSQPQRQREREGHVPPCPVRDTFPSPYWFHSSPFSTPIHAAGDLGWGWVGTGCSFQVQELFLLPTCRLRERTDSYQVPGNAVPCSFP